MAKNKKLRKGLIITILSLVTLTALILLIVPPFIKSKVKKELITNIENMLYTKASVGDISINWRKGIFTVTDIELTGINTFENIKMLNIPEIELKLSENSGTKLSNITLDNLLIENTDVFVFINSKGENCWQTKPEITSIEIDTSENILPNISINKLTITNLNIYYTNQANGQSLQILDNSLSVIKCKDLNYNYTFNTNGIGISSGHHSKHTPCFKTEGMIVLQDDMFKVSGHSFINQLYTEYNITYNKLESELAELEFILPECSTREVLSVLRPIDSIENEKIISEGTWQARIRLESSSQKLVKANAELNIINAKVKNKSTGDFASIESSLVLDYTSNKSVADNNLEAYTKINLNTDEIFGKLSITKIDDKSVIEGGSIGYLELEKLNDVLESSVYKFAGNISTSGSIKGQADTTNVSILSDLKTSISDMKLINTETGTDLLINSSANCINGKFNIETDFVTSKAYKYKSYLELINFWEYLFKNETLELNARTIFPKVTIPMNDSKAYSNNLYNEQIKYEGVNINDFFPENISISHEFLSDTLYIGNSLFNDLYVSFKFNNKQIGLNKLSMTKNDSYIDMSLYINYLNDTITLLHFSQQSNNLLFDTTLTSKIKGSLDTKADFKMNIDKNGKPIIESINGSYLIIPKDFYLQQDQLSKKASTKFKFNDNEFIPISTDSIVVKVTNGDLELLPFYIVSAKSGLRGKGHIYQLDSLDISFNARIAENYQSKSVILAIKGLALMQKTEFIDDNSPIELGINISGTINKPKYNIFLIE